MTAPALTIVVPTYWGRPLGESPKPGDAIFDHPTPLDGDSTLPRLLESLARLESGDAFRLLILVAPVTPSLAAIAEQRVAEMLRPYAERFEAGIVGAAVSPLLKPLTLPIGLDPSVINLNNYAGVRNLQLMVPQALGDSLVVALDDDEVVAPDYLRIALETARQPGFSGAAGFYEDGDGSIYLPEAPSTGNIFHDKPAIMNEATHWLQDAPGRWVDSVVAFGGNMLFGRDLFSQVGFDPGITRGEDLDYVLNARLAGFRFWLDKRLRITHLPPQVYDTSPYAKLSEDVRRFVYEREKLRHAQRAAVRSGIAAPSADIWNPYPGRFMQNDLEEQALAALTSICSTADQQIWGEPTEIIKNALTRSVSLVPQYFDFVQRWPALMKALALDAEMQQQLHHIIARPVNKLMNNPESRIKTLLTSLYGQEIGGQVWPELEARLTVFRECNPHLAVDVQPLNQRLTEQDAILITYGDQFSGPENTPLQTLTAFLDKHLSGVINSVHILPFFPYSSDDGFSIIDFKQVDPNLGSWEDVDGLGQGRRLMFDAVINHISQFSDWFQRFRLDEPPFIDYFITVDPAEDLSQVVRPRTLPLLMSVGTSSGIKHVWTTFSPDQIDLNYANPQVQLEIIGVLLDYVEHGAEIIRLDAIAYLWKEIGTSCIHLPQTHAVIKLWRAVLDTVAPGVLLITETNVPHDENISYFGDPLPETGGTDEAQLVYNFTLAPLTLNAFQTGDASHLSAWAATLKTPTPGAAFFNFIASHDGIGVRPAEGILTAAEVQALVEQTQAHGGEVNYKDNPDGPRSVYELNTTLYDFLNDPLAQDMDVDVRRFLASQAILLSIAGVPGIYIHSLFGSRNCAFCYDETERPRSLNREKFFRPELEAILADSAYPQRHVFDGYRDMLRIRRQHTAFHPSGEQQILDISPTVFAVIRTAPTVDERVLCLINVSEETQMVELMPALVGNPTFGYWFDLLGGERYAVGQMELDGYGVLWLVAQK